MKSTIMFETHLLHETMLQEEILRNAVPADRCPCGAVRVIECDFGSRLKAWVMAEDVGRPSIVTMKLCVQPFKGWERREWVHRNCPSCDTAFGFVDRVPVIFPGMHYVVMGMLLEKPDSPIISEDPPIPSTAGSSEGDPYSEFEWSDDD